MCHGVAVAAFPEPKLGTPYTGAIKGYVYDRPGAEKRLAILPDIYGCNPFYQCLAQYYQDAGAHVVLVDTFAGLGELPEMSRELAFARRGKVNDKAFVDAFQAFCEAEGITGVLGFCLGGLYIFELARRGLKADLVGLYGFPQGMANVGPLPVPFEYLPSVTQPFTMLMGREDASVLPENVDRLADMDDQCPAMALTVYREAGHGFLPEISGDDPMLQAVAKDALAKMDAALL